MPYEWITPPDDTESPPITELHLWAYRSLLRRDFVTFISLTAALILVPLVAFIGSPALWALLPFFLIMLGGLWWALHRSYKDGETLEKLRLWPDHMTLDHHGPKHGHKTWAANPYWVHVTLTKTGGPVENYLTLQGNDRKVELGAFLSEDERADLYDDLLLKLRQLT